MAGHGGRREGAGRPPGSQRKFETAAAYLLHLINANQVPVGLKLKAAVALLAHERPGPRGVKILHQEAAQAAAKGAYEPPAAPRLVLVDPEDAA